ncbi:hypothetical protein WSM22_32790 [Cytophagales bacterium WSM2-2]|nr:hypothetical protein WSM22_32790 [Cytophagales bacterium WSM2-2]
MLQPPELKLNLPVVIANDVTSSTIEVWNILSASYRGDLDTVKRMTEKVPELAYAQFNYTPPIHFAVREGHVDLVRYLLNLGAHDREYKIYPFLDKLEMMADDRGHREVLSLLEEYAQHPEAHKFKGDNGAIKYGRTSLQSEFEKAVDKNEIERVKQILTEHPEFALDETYFWSEGVLMTAVKIGHFEMVDLLLKYGARVPSVLKWTQFYYFEQLSNAELIMQRGMSPNVMSWHHVTVLHDMAQKGRIQKAELLIKHGADINPIEEEYQSTPLGMAARWGHLEMVEFLLKHGADPNKSGAPWSTPLTWAKKKGHSAIEKMLRDSGAR